MQSIWPRLLGLSILLLPLLATAQTSKVIGRSRQNRPIKMLTFGNGPSKVLILGGVHGDETPSVPLVQDLTAYLEANPDIVAGRTISIIQEVNPDGVAAGTRANSIGVDLNRNMEYDWSPAPSTGGLSPGTAPYSEPETVALRNVLIDFKPGRILSVHAFANILDYDTNNGLVLASLMAKKNGMTVTTIGYPTPGSLGRYCVANNIPLVTLELPAGRTRADIWAWQRPALVEFIVAGL
ncbi:MAG: succinylglutamate desuccinylase/aspartoacylase family protein [Armatimonadetes bacterium]|nr:succinylglutamate desuccinylase/aspartoacylase family protein [Armatimonadota bacterium]